MNNCRIIALLTVFAGITGCTHSVRPSIPSQEIPGNEPLSNTTTPARQRWLIRTDELSRTYRLIQQVHIKTVDTAQFQQDTSTRMVDFSVQRTPGIIAARINTIVGVRLDDTAINRLPLSVTGHWTSSSISIDQPDAAQASACTTSTLSVVPSITAAAILLTPPQIEAGSAWTDTLSTTSCAGSVRILTKTIRRFRVISETTTNQRGAIALEEQETSTSSGEGSEGQHLVQITTSGTGAGRFVIDARNGSVLEATTETRTLIQIKSSGRLKQFEQVVKGMLHQSI